MALKEAFARALEFRSELLSGLGVIVVASAAVVTSPWRRKLPLNDCTFKPSEYFVYVSSAFQLALRTSKYLMSYSPLAPGREQSTSDDGAHPPCRAITPTLLDMRRSDAELRSLAVSSLQDTVSPLFAVQHFGFEDLLNDAVSLVRERENLDSSPPSASCSVYVLRAQDSDSANEYYDKEDARIRNFHKEMRELSRRLLRILLGDAALAEIDANDQYVDGKLSLRFYPGSDTSIRLNAHVDANLFTLLWAGGPGYEVLDPRHEELNNVRLQDVLQVGMPLIGDPSDLDLSADEFYSPVCPGKKESPTLMLGIGVAWWRSTLVQEHFPQPERVRCPLLHRVKLEGSKPRYSIPYLVDVHEKLKGAS
eukprot:TRINITY_DN23571_c0_g1_i1.p1 TRINITY_DN23571_c0_g1~~TRINITY_DN23571_c0_g1_i1.p1  ORF type:complete len:365 (-),score=62.96 TRINITY_DN23571_c0_g1_i1:159-1253(-)